MKTFLTVSFICLALFTHAQQTPLDSGFTNKAEAKNKMVNGIKDGKWVEYDTCYTYSAKGDTIPELCSYTLTVYKAGTPFGVQRLYDSTGRLTCEIPYKSGKENGIERRYNDNGKLSSETTYLNGKRNGVEKDYYDNGKLKTQILYKFGKAGETTSYDENGKEIK
jgi:antitoxin component YwqK of YwqJK toxin-antitoxin module